MNKTLALFILCAVSWLKLPALNLEKYISNLKIVSSKSPLLGHNDTYLYGESWTYGHGESDIYRVCQKMPAVYSTDLDGIETGKSNYAGPVTYQDMKQTIQEHYRRGGIITISWHARQPLSGKSYTDTSDNLIVRKMLSKGKGQQVIEKCLDKVAEFLLSLRDDKGELIPVIFRPWHECNGNWFWWGTKGCSAEEYKRLWIYTHDYLEQKGCTNLVYAFSPGSDFKDQSTYMERFPGVKYVDILGFEAYRRDKGDVTSSRQEFIQRVQHNLVLLENLSSELNLPYAITESGFQANADSKWWSKAVLPAVKGYKPLFITFWSNQWPFKGRNTCCTYPTEQSANDLKRLVAKGKFGMID